MDNENLLARIEALERWKQERERQQIKLPLDATSIAVLQKYFMRLTSSIQTTSATGNTFITYLGSQGNPDFVGPGLVNFQVAASNLFPYTVNATSDVFTIAYGRFSNDERVIVDTEDTAPAPLVVGTDYYVVNAASDGQTFKLSATLGGAAINITTTGTGSQYISYL